MGAVRQSEGRGAFTLVELLTVIAIVAVLATLLMTAVVSAKKQSRVAVSTLNLRQISLALNMYLDDFNRRPPGIDEVVAGKYLAERRTLLCPEDKTGDWGRLSSVPLGLPVRSLSDVPSEPAVPYSYLLHPLNWTDAAWNGLMRHGSSAGLAACQLHGLGRQNLAFPSMRDFEGLLLRGQRDGAVVRRRIFWGRDAVLPVEGATFSVVPGSSPDQSNPLTDAALWPIYVDSPVSW
jgi:prepilin-type N-terminal cleavage/methylation domain-containing protein